MKPVTAEQMAEIDRRAREEYGIAQVVLMENAGRSAAEEISTGSSSFEKEKVALFCGRGNNGGDGFVVARWLAARGASVEILLFCRGDDLSGDAAANFNRIRSHSIPLRELPDDSHDAMAAERIAAADILVDALLGTGFSGAPRGRIADAIRLSNGAKGEE